MSAADKQWLDSYAEGARAVHGRIHRTGWAQAKGVAKSQIRAAAYWNYHGYSPGSLDAYLDALGC